MPEKWLPVIEYEGLYEISDHGQVKALAKIDALGRSKPEIIMKQRLTGKQPSPRLAVQLRKDGVSRTKYVHIMMLESFVGPRPLGQVGCHLDDTPRNDLSNLKWDTVSGNNFDLVRNGNHARARRTECKRGHPLVPNNIYINPTSKARCCRKCLRAYAIEKQNKIRQSKPQKICPCGQPAKSSRAIWCIPCKRKRESKRALKRYYDLRAEARQRKTQEGEHHQ